VIEVRLNKAWPISRSQHIFEFERMPVSLEYRNSSVRIALTLYIAQQILRV